MNSLLQRRKCSDNFFLQEWIWFLLRIIIVACPHDNASGVFGFFLTLSLPYYNRIELLSHIFQMLYCSFKLNSLLEYINIVSNIIIILLCLNIVMEENSVGDPTSTRNQTNLLYINEYKSLLISRFYGGWVRFKVHFISFNKKGILHCIKFFFNFPAYFVLVFFFLCICIWNLIFL